MRSGRPHKIKKPNPMAKDLRQPKYRLKVFTDKTKIIPRKWKYKNGNS